LWLLVNGSLLQIALHFVQDKNTRFDLAIECGNLDVALETARAIDRPDCWERLALQGLKQGNHKVSFVE
jgi:coatomer protein complex subunit alpha (xenin)